MWQLYASTAFDIVAERQREARRAARVRRTDWIATRERSSAWRRFAAGILGTFGRVTGAVADASCALAARLRDPLVNA